jgi:20S proteasome alpha/beta subunit
MGVSTTIIAALKFEGGVLIASDSQASDPVAKVKWAVEKLDQVKPWPLVIGFSGNTGMASRAREAIGKANIYRNMFDKPKRIRDLLDRCLDPIYDRIKEMNKYGLKGMPWEVGLWGLAAFVCKGTPYILEYELSGDCTFHDYFHAIGSGSSTAYAIYRTLGGKDMVKLSEDKATLALLRIMRTCVDVEVWGVSDPFSLWTINSNGASKKSPDHINALAQVVDEWEAKDIENFFME